MFLEEVSKRAKKYDIDQHLFGSFEYTRTLNLKDDSNSFDGSQPEIQLTPSTPTNARQKIKQICRQVKNQISLNNRIKLKAGLGSGDIFPDLGQLKPVQAEQLSPIRSEQGEILVFVLWSFENDKGIIKSFKQFFEKIDQKKVRIISITLNEQINALKQNISQVGKAQLPNMKIDHFNITGKESECNIIYVLGEAIVPYACYVDQNKIVKFIGHPKKLLEVLNNGELQKKVVAKKEKKENLKGEDVIDGKQFSQIQKKFSNRQQFKKSFPNISSIFLQMHINSCCVQGITKCQVKSIKACLKKGDQKAIEKQFESIKNIKIQMQYIKELMLPKLGKDCFQCKKQLAYPFYWCEGNKNDEDFRCIDCVQKKSQEKPITGCILLMEELTHIYSGYLDAKRNNNSNCQLCKKDISEGQALYICLQEKLTEKQSNLKVLCDSCGDKLKKKEQSVKNWLTNEKISLSYAWLRIQSQPKMMVEPSENHQE